MSGCAAHTARQVRLQTLGHGGLNLRAPEESCAAFVEVAAQRPRRVLSMRVPEPFTRDNAVSLLPCHLHLCWLNYRACPLFNFSAGAYAPNVSLCDEVLVLAFFQRGHFETCGRRSLTPLTVGPLAFDVCSRPDL
jgi:hypothetical protein